MAHERAGPTSAVGGAAARDCGGVARSAASRATPSAAGALQHRLGNQATHALVNRFLNGSSTASVVGFGGAESAHSGNPSGTSAADQPRPVVSRCQTSPKARDSLQVSGNACPNPVQTKLTVSAPGDAYEREADLMADVVMRMPEPPLQIPVHSPVSATSSRPPSVQLLCAGCDDELSRTAPLADPPMPHDAGQAQRKDEPAAAPQITPSVSANIHAMQGGGSPLPSATRAFFEPRFGADFSHVRVHTGARAEETAKSINAKAFTVGRDIAFAGGQYAPQSHEGRRLLAHELTHVVQQDGEQMQRARTQARERAATGGAAPEQGKGP